MLKSRTFWKIYVSFILFMVLNSFIVGVVLVYQIDQDEIFQTQFKLTSYANLFTKSKSEFTKDSSPELKQQIESLHEGLGARLTMIRKDGLVLADSDEDPLKMENHASRPEVIQAKLNGIGKTTRFSNTVKKNMMYVAIPIMDNGFLLAIPVRHFPFPTSTNDLPIFSLLD